MGWKPSAHGEDHAARHADGGADELDAADLASGAATDGQVLTADGAGGAAWEDAAAGAGALDDLTDVVLSSPSNGEVLKYNGSEWVNDTDDTGSGSLPTPSAKGDIAVWDGSAWVVVGVGSDGQVLTADSGESAGVGWAAGGGGGGGKSYVTDPNLKPPDSAHGSDVEFVGLANGTSFATAGLTWANQGSRVASIKGGRLAVEIPSAVSDYGGIVVPAPAGDFSMAVRLRSTVVQNWHALGLLALDDSAVGTFTNWRECVRITFDGNLYHSDVTSGWGVSTNRANRRHYMLVGGPIYLKWEWDDTADTLKSFMTMDPLAGWDQVGSVTKSGQPPTYVGVLLCGQDSGTYPLYGSYDFIRFDWTPDFDPTTDD